MRNSAVTQERLVVCVTGMPGAGKSTLAEAAARIGFNRVNLGDVVRAETVRRRLAPTDKNLGMVMQALRSERGPGAMAELALPRMAKGKQLVVIDGVRSMAEVAVFRKMGPTKLLGVHAAPRVRYQFLRRRARADAPLSWRAFTARDRRELAVGLGEVLPLADEIISNNGVTRRQVQERAARLLRQWMNSLAP